MEPVRGIESDGDYPRLVLSMRTKVSIVGLCFVVSVALAAMYEVPNVVEALRGIGTDGGPEDGQEYVILFRDDFDSPNPHWKFVESERKYLRDGYLILNSTKTTDTSNQVGLMDRSDSGEIPHPWLYANMEVRLKINDEGIVEDGLGGGNKWWGFKDSWLEMAGEQRFLQFCTYSNKSDPPFIGFWAQFGVLPGPGIWDIQNGFLYNERITTAEISPGDWHTYRYLWSPNNGTLIIDGKTIATTDTVPTTPMGINIHIHDLVRYGSDWDGYHNDFSPIPYIPSLQVDYVQVYVTKEYFDEMDADISAFLNRSQEIIQELTNRGEDTTHLNRYYNQVRNLWREGYYLYPPARALLVPLMEVLYNYDEIEAGFTAAEAAIDTLYAQGDNRTAMMCEADLAKARRLWVECDYKATSDYLQKIKASVPEASILTALGSILPFLLKRNRRKG